jgi:cytoskeleton protein RodZ
LSLDPWRNFSAPMAEPNKIEQNSAGDIAGDIKQVSGVDDLGVDDRSSVIASTDIGTLLCATRMRMGKDLQLIAEILHIRYTYLVAIEDGRYEDLPGQAYAVGFVRSYADHLGLDGSEVVRRFKEENSGVKRKASFEFPIPTPDSGVPSGALLLLAVVFGMVVYGAWFSIAGSDRSAVQLIQEVPSRLTALLENRADTAPFALTEAEGLAEPAAAVTLNAARTDSASGAPVLSGEPTPGNVEARASEGFVTSPTTTLVAPGPNPSNFVEDQDAQTSVAVSPATPAGPQSSSEITPRPVEASPPVRPSEILAGSSAPSPATIEEVSREDSPESPVPSEIEDKPAPATRESNEPVPTDAEPQQDASADDAVAINVVELRAKADSWIQLREGDELLLTRLLRKGEVFRVPERGGLTLMTGNAGGLEVLVNGEVMPPLGVEGTVARGVPLDPQHLKGLGG